ncbi:CAP domain-containing protein [Pseudovibrio japonicus]|uniref:CAP domain-containing protein n=1 Tax=Pseudovibrio japonicus TaxID=366534 RepID=UPI001AD8AD45|nr:CAP domain-containing protein [Pseudovibrio japonicus]
MNFKYKATAALFLAATLAGCVGFGSGSPELTHVAVNQNEALRQVNAWRAQHSVPPLQLDPHLTSVSQDMADHVARRDTLQTPRHSSSSLSRRTQTSEYRTAAGAENLGAGYSTLTQAITGWKNSPGHNSNLLSRHVTHMGIARTNRADGTYRNFWVMTLAAPGTPAAASGGPTAALPVPAR